MAKKRRLLITLLLLSVLTAALLPSLASPAGKGFITGTVYFDRNLNGQLDAGENPLTDVELTLMRGETEVASLSTNPDGSYSFSGLTEGVYTIRARLPEEQIAAPYLEGGSELIPSGGRRAQTVPLTLSDGATMNVNLGSMSQKNGSYIRAVAFGDSNLNGGRFSNEPLLKGVQVELLIKINDTYYVVSSAATDREGLATLPRVAPGTYELGAMMTEGYVIGPLGAKLTQFYNTILPSEGSYGRSAPFKLPANGSLGLGIGGALTGSGKVIVWDDQNFNGIQEAGEPGVSGVSVTLQHQTMGVERIGVSDEKGQVSFPLLQPGDYTLTATLDQSRMFTVSGGDSLFSSDDSRSESRTVRVAAQQESDFGRIGVIRNTSLSLKAFHDSNVNGLAEDGEPVFAGARLTVLKNGSQFAALQSDADGMAVLPLVRAGEYELRLSLPDGQIFSVDGGENGSRFFSDKAASELTIPFTLKPGQDNLILAGVTLPGGISGALFVDTNSNGVWDSGEEMMPGFGIQALNEKGQVVAETQTIENGSYQLPALVPGNYSVRMMLQSPYIFSGAPSSEAEYRNRVISQTPEYGDSDVFPVQPGQQVEHVDGAIFRSAVIEGDVLLGDESDGFSGQLGGLAGAFIELLNEDGMPVSSYTVATSDQAGHYLLKGALPGLYSLRYTLPEGAAFSRPLSDERSFTSSQFNVNAGDALSSQPLFVVKTGTYSGRAYIDSNINGRYDKGDQPVSGLRVLMESAIPANTREAVSAEDGSYSISGLRPGSFSLKVTLDEGLIFSYDGLSPFTPATSNASNADVTIAMGEINPDNQIAALPRHHFSGRLFYDNNLDGSAAMDEPGLPGTEIRLRHELSGVEFKAVTDVEGGFDIPVLFPGSYKLSFALAEDHILFAPKGTQSGGNWETPLTLDLGQNETTLPLALVQFGAIDGSVYNLGGTQENVTNLSIRLLNEKGEPVAQTASDASGYYRFEKLYPGSYRLEATLPEGYLFAREIDSRNARFSRITADGEGNEINGPVGLSAVFSLQMAQQLLSQDIGIGAPGQLGDYAWLDLDHDGMQDTGEPGVPGVEIRLIQYGEVVAQAQTDAYGRYLLENLYPGSYTMMVKIPQELAATVQQTEFPLVASILPQQDASELSIENLVIPGGGRNLNADFGLVERKQGVHPADIDNPPQKNWTPYEQVQVQPGS